MQQLTILDQTVKRPGDQLFSPATGLQPTRCFGALRDATLSEISAKVIEQAAARAHQKTMQPKRENQPTFFDLAVQQRGATNRVLQTVTREVDFTEAETRVAATYSPDGRPACRVGVLLRVMILQHLYGLSDPQAEEQLKDRLSFQKFVQLDTHEAVRAETTICLFRQRLIVCGLHEAVLALLNTQLEARGYIVKRVTLVDANKLESIFLNVKYPNSRLASFFHHRPSLPPIPSLFG